MFISSIILFTEFLQGEVGHTMTTNLGPSALQTTGWTLRYAPGALMQATAESIRLKLGSLASSAGPPSAPSAAGSPGSCEPRSARRPARPGLRSTTSVDRRTAWSVSWGRRIFLISRNLCNQKTDLGGRLFSTYKSLTGLISQFMCLPGQMPQVELESIIYRGRPYPQALCGYVRPCQILFPQSQGSNHPQAGHRRR